MVCIYKPQAHTDKVLYYHQGGYCLWSKRLEKGTFARADDDSKKQALIALSYSAWLMVFIGEKTNKTSDLTDWICYDSSYENTLKYPQTPSNTLPDMTSVYIENV